MILTRSRAMAMAMAGRMETETRGAPARGLDVPGEEKDPSDPDPNLWFGGTSYHPFVKDMAVYTLTKWVILKQRLYLETKIAD